MSWAANNPEAYDNILKDGVVNRINRELDDAGFEEMDSDTVIAIVDSIFKAADSTVKNALIKWSL